MKLKSNFLLIILIMGIFISMAAVGASDVNATDDALGYCDEDSSSQVSTGNNSDNLQHALNSQDDIDCADLNCSDNGILKMSENNTDELGSVERTPSKIAVTGVNADSKSKTISGNRTFGDGDNVFVNSKSSKSIVKAPSKTKATNTKVTPKSKAIYKCFVLCPKFKWQVKRVGIYKIKYILWKVRRYNGYSNFLDIIFYRYNHQQSSYSYITKMCYKSGGRWTWTRWGYGSVNHAYHRYATRVPISKFMIYFRYA